MNLYPRRILIVRLSSLGDVISALPALTALRRLFSQAHIAWAVESPSDELLLDHPYLNEVIVVERRKWVSRLKRPWSFRSAVRQGLGAARELAAKGFDLAIDFQGNLRSGVVSFASRAPVRLGLGPGYVREFAHRFTNIHYYPKGAPLHRVEEPLRLVSLLGDFPEAPEPVVPRFRAEDMQLETEFLKCELPQRFVLLHPGTSRFGEFKRWPVANFGELALKLSEQRSADVLVSWGPGEKELAERVIRASRGAARLAPATPSLRHMAELIRRCDVFVAADTGVLHLAWALGKPLVGLFGPKDERIQAPRGPHVRIVTADVPCRPCTRRRCKDSLCMSRLPAPGVLSAILDLLL